MGYERAVREGAWIFQADSDEEMPPDHFRILWEARADYDLLIGKRTCRAQTWDRKVISWCSRAWVRMLFGTGVDDDNTPYRLMRREPLSVLLALIPADTLAPNVILSGLFAKYRYRIYHTDVPFTVRRTGTVSLLKWGLWRFAIRACAQTISAAVRAWRMKEVFNTRKS